MNERTVRSRRAYEGRLIHLDVAEVETDTGMQATREIVRHPGAVAVLARLPDGRFVFVRQFRKAVEQVVVEVIAGCLKSGEEPGDCARREAKEETGYEVKSLRALGHLFPTPGYCDERIHAFFAELAPAPAAQAADEDEALDVVYLSRQELEEMMRRGEIRDAKTLAVWLLCEKASLV